MVVQYAILIFLGLNSFTCGHSLNKRQHSILTLDVNPYQGNEPTHAQASELPVEYHFPIDAAVLNISCTVTNPSFKYKLSIYKEQKFNNGESLAPIEILSSNEYSLSSTLDPNKYSIEFSEVGGGFKVVLTIRNLKLEDNGLYTCKYNQIVRKINAVIYKTPSLSHITFPTGKADKMNLNSLVSLTCRVLDVYPKPKVFFSHPTKNLNDSTVEKDISSTKHNEYYPYSISSTVNFTVDYKDHNKVINCSVQSTGAQVIQLSKSYQMQVIGNQFIENSCKDNVIAKFGDDDFKLECRFFSNPKSEVEWVIENQQKKTTTTTTESSETNSDNSETNDQEPLVLRAEDENEFYKVTVEELENGVYTAVLKFNKVREEDFRSYTIKIGSISRSIRVVANERELAKSLSDQHDSSLAFKLHSNTNFLIINFILYVIFLKR